MKQNIFKTNLLSNPMKKEGVNFGLYFLRPIGFYNNISCSNLIGVTQLGSSFGPTENRTRDSYLPSMHVTTTPSAH